MDTQQIMGLGKGQSKILGKFCHVKKIREGKPSAL